MGNVSFADMQQFFGFFAFGKDSPGALISHMVPGSPVCTSFEWHKLNFKFSTGKFHINLWIIFQNIIYRARCDLQNENNKKEWSRVITTHNNESLEWSKSDLQRPLVPHRIAFHFTLILIELLIINKSVIMVV